MSRNKEKLIKLEKTGDYLFHGSGRKIDILEPRQAYNHLTFSSEGAEKDGEPAVFASHILDVAIFMAIISEENAPKGYRSGFTINGGCVEFRATQDTLDQLENSVGYIHVLDKNFLKRRNKESGEWVSYKVVKPVQIVEVSEKDLPSNIEIKKF